MVISAPGCGSGTVSVQQLLESCETTSEQSLKSLELFESHEAIYGQLLFLEAKLFLFSSAYG